MSGLEPLGPPIPTDVPIVPIDRPDPQTPLSRVKTSQVPPTFVYSPCCECKARRVIMGGENKVPRCADCNMAYDRGVKIDSGTRINRKQVK